MEKRFVLSDGSVNSHGFRLDMEKIQLERFRSNPVMLYNHYDLIGKWTDISLEDGVLTAIPDFMDDKDEPVALKVKKRVSNGYLKGASLGIRILEVREQSGEPPVVTAEVLEASIVDIPANANALALYDESGKRLEGEAYRLALKTISKPKTTIKHYNNNMELNKDTLSKLGLGANPGIEAIDAAIKELVAEKELLQKELQDLKQKQINDLLDTAIREGRLQAGLKEKYAKLAEKDFELFAETLKSLPKASKLPEVEPVEKGDARLSGREDWTFNDWRKKDPSGLLHIKKTDTELYQKILNK